ncbi:YceK/YidQ family lipoprotein [Leptospira sp. WS92.C1]
MKKYLLPVFILALFSTVHCATIQSIYEIRWLSQFVPRDFTITNEEKISIFGNLNDEFEYDPNDSNPIYSGVRYGAKRFPSNRSLYFIKRCYIANSNICMFGAILTFPIALSLVTAYEIVDFTASVIGDTLFLPITIPWKLEKIKRHQIDCRNWAPFMKILSMDELEIRTKFRSMIQDQEARSVCWTPHDRVSTLLDHLIMNQGIYDSSYSSKSDEAPHISAMYKLFLLIKKEKLLENELIKRYYSKSENRNSLFSYRIQYELELFDFFDRSINDPNEKIRILTQCKKNYILRWSCIFEKTNLPDTLPAVFVYFLNTQGPLYNAPLHDTYSLDFKNRGKVTDPFPESMRKIYETFQTELSGSKIKNKQSVMPNTLQLVLDSFHPERCKSDWIKDRSTYFPEIEKRNRKAQVIVQLLKKDGETETTIRNFRKELKKRVSGCYRDQTIDDQTTELKGWMKSIFEKGPGQYFKDL